MNFIWNQDARLPLNIGQVIDLVVTSPPYFNLVDYQTEGQIGFRGSFERYIEDLNQVWSNLISHLGPNGAICINIGCTLEISRKNQNRLFDTHHHILEFFCTHGFYLHADIIWALNNSKYFERQVRRYHSSYPRSEKLLLNDYEHILVFKRSTSYDALQEADLESVECISGVWSIPWDYEGFPPPLAPPLVHRLIQLFSERGDLVFDPFMGLGTVARVASTLGRSFCGTELNPETYSRCLEELSRAQVPLQREILPQSELCSELANAS